MNVSLSNKYQTTQSRNRSCLALTCNTRISHMNHESDDHSTRSLYQPLSRRWGNVSCHRIGKRYCRETARIRTEAYLPALLLSPKIVDNVDRACILYGKSSQRHELRNQLLQERFLKRTHRNTRRRLTFRVHQQMWCKHICRNSLPFMLIYSINASVKGIRFSSK